MLSKTERIEELKKALISQDEYLVKKLAPKYSNNLEGKYFFIVCDDKKLTEYCIGEGGIITYGYLLYHYDSPKKFYKVMMKKNRASFLNYALCVAACHGTPKMLSKAIKKGAYNINEALGCACNTNNLLNELYLLNLLNELGAESYCTYCMKYHNIYTNFKFDNY